MKTLTYVGYYDTADNAAQQRGFTLSAVNKMDYIISAIRRSGWQVELVSASRTAGEKSCPGSVREISDGVTLRLFPSLGMGGPIRRALRTVQAQGHLLWRLLRHTRRGEPVLVYHSLGYVNVIRWARKLRGFRLILEVEEIYADVTGDGKARRREQRLFDSADAFVFSTELLDEKLNPTGRPSAVCCGTYREEPNRNCGFEEPDLQGKIHCIYAGTLDPRKGGAQAAASAAGRLPSGYFLHILGFGSPEEKKNLQETVDEAAKRNGAEVRYDGLRRGEDYIRFLQSCQVGLSTQSPGAEFNDTSFPSKVLSYLANGLRVVSIRIPALELSPVSGLLYYYDEDTPEAIAKAIRSIDFTQPYDSRAVIRELDREFTAELGKLLAG